MAGEHQPAAEEKAKSDRIGRGRDHSVALNGLFVLALFYTFYLASSFLLPIVMAVLFALLLKPLVRALRRVRIPEALGAFVVLGSAGSLLLLIGSLLFEPAVRWVETAPQSMARIEQKLEVLKGPLEKFGRATEEVERLADDDDDEDDVPKVEIRSERLRDVILLQTPGFLFSGLLTVVLVYFLLANGNRFLHDLVRSLPGLEAKKRAVEISRAIEQNVSTYLATISLINVGLGLAVAAAMYLLKMPNPLLWGAMAGLFNFIPYLGPLFTLIVLALVAILTFDSAVYALLVPATFYLINLVEAYLVTPVVLGRRLLLNPVVIFVGLMFWFWLWGIAGGLLAVPILVSFKIVCDHIPSLQRAGDVLGHKEEID